MDYLPMTIRKQKNIALIAHDQKKRELIQWCDEHKDIPVSYTHLDVYKRQNIYKTTGKKPTNCS